MVHCCHGHITVLYVLRMRHYVLHHFLEHSIFPHVRFIHVYVCVWVSSYSCWICRLIVGSAGQVITVSQSSRRLVEHGGSSTRPPCRPCVRLERWKGEGRGSDTLSTPETRSVPDAMTSHSDEVVSMCVYL